MSLGEFFSNLQFDADAFQRQAAAALDAGQSVVVTAPTGAGKTLVAEAGIHLAFERNCRVFYTTPLKALSNQKFADFSAAYGTPAVGLLTGDNSIRGDAPLVVMTTEVLRNMIYADSSALDGLKLVVLDEVHYLQDPLRGMVWEEVIIHLPSDVQVACLSATIANPEEFTSWVESRRGATALIIERQRPVPLQSLYLLKQRHHGGALQDAPLFIGAERGPNTQLASLLRRNRNRYGRFGTPRRGEVASWLEQAGMLPAIYFVFSRRGCDEAAAAVASMLTFTSQDERETIASHAATRTAHLPPGELSALGYGSWLEMLRHGVAAHHAGLVPAFKETVEDLFSSGILKLVFATETLALGINMPAKSVVLDKLSRFTGKGHRLLEPGDYTQLTGRAGRRGIDDRGTAVVLHSRFVPFDRVVGIAGPGAHPLRSSFRPNYNMAVNLVAIHTRSQAEDVLR
ncbi:MAG: DEAD/DEAH box helicase, partial [Acidimicrobiia bacterium]